MIKTVEAIKLTELKESTNLTFMGPCIVRIF
jgi:hypothetical protein